MASEEIKPASEPHKPKARAISPEVINGQRCHQCAKRMVINFDNRTQDCWNCGYQTYL